MRQILIAEDESFIATLYKTHFEKHPNVTVTIAADGKQAVEALEKGKYDLLLLDLIMPNMDGYEVLAYFKKKELKLPVVVVLSNLSLDIDKAECRRLGAEDYIVKADNDAPAVWEKVQKFLPAAEEGAIAK